MSDVMTQGLKDERGALEFLGGLGRTKLYELTASGEVASVKIGRRRFWPTSALQEFVDRLAAAG